MPGLDAEQIDMWDYWDEAQPTPEPDKTTTMDKVREFAEVMGQKPDPELSATLVREEFLEWSEERYLHNHQNLSNQKDELKELSDLVYVIYGYANARGWNLDEAIKRVHENNIGRCVQPDGTIKRRADGKILKNPDFPAVVLDDLV
jgi:predicted house-cleaning noncanonical NTP pyrophosphatase (MazG superfamily)